MKETIGATWLTGIVITFIVLFAGFLSYSISYTKAFRVKNEIINIIEKNEGYTCSTAGKDLYNDPDLSEDTSTQAQAFNFIKSMGYNYSLFDSSSNLCSDGKMMAGGYCISRKVVQNNTRAYYKITTFVSLSIPIINVGVKIPISGETKALYYESTQSGCI